jgi:hypothetical protein
MNREVDAQRDRGLLAVLDDDLADGTAIARADDFDQVLAGRNAIELKCARGVGRRAAA